MTPCPFCAPLEPVLENALAFAIFDRNPVTPGHLLLIARRHVESWFDATPEEQAALLALAQVGQRMLTQSHAPQGYNLGVNIGAVAGQTIPHLHVHLIPRYHDDCAAPRGGVRGVIPEKQDYPAAPDQG